jgi:putative transcriptional regulator
MKKERFQELLAGLEEVREYVATGRFKGRVHQVEVPADDVRGIRVRSGMTQQQFAETFGIGLGTLRKWESGERRPSGAAKSLLQVMQADLPAVIKALKVTPPKRHRRPRQLRTRHRAA